MAPEPADRAAWVDFALENNFNLQAARHSEEAARQNAAANRLEPVSSMSRRACSHLAMGVGKLSISMRIFEAASSIKSMALSGKNRSVM